MFEDDSLPVTCACVASISTKSGLDVPVEPNVDREEELQALRAAEPLLWYDTEFDREQEIAGMNKEMTSIKDFDVYEEKVIAECTPDQLQNSEQKAMASSAVCAFVDTTKKSIPTTLTPALHHLSR